MRAFEHTLRIQQRKDTKKNAHLQIFCAFFFLKAAFFSFFLEIAYFTPSPLIEQTPPSHSPYKYPSRFSHKVQSSLVRFSHSSLLPQYCIVCSSYADRMLIVCFSLRHPNLTRRRQDRQADRDLINRHAQGMIHKRALQASALFCCGYH